MISIFQGQSPKNKSEFPIKTAGSVGFQVYIYIAMHFCVAGQIIE